MIVVIVVDTSPSMGRAVQGGLSRLDLAKMAVEDLTRQWKRLRPPTVANLGHEAAMGDHFLLLTTSRQHPDTAACAAGGRLLVGFETLHSQRLDEAHLDHSYQAPFANALKNLKVAKVDDTSKPWSGHNGGAPGMNAALSMGLQLMSRYRLQNRETENFGMGRLPCAAISLSQGTTATAALQSACLIVFTDGACLRHPPNQGGGSLQIKFGSSPLREFYKDHFRWDQRVFVQAIGARPGVTSSQYLHPHLRELCSVTSGAHWSVSNSADIPKINTSLLQRLCPPVPKELPLPDPLFQHLGGLIPSSSVATGIEASFVNSAPTVILQAIDETETHSTSRVMIFYVGSSATTFKHQEKMALSPPLFVIPEAFFPSKRNDTLPPREAHPRLFYSLRPGHYGSKTFDPLQLIKTLHRYDKMVAANRKEAGQPIRLLHRDVYVCNWIDTEGEKTIEKTMLKEFFPLFVPFAGRPSLAEDSDNFLNVGILHVPPRSTTLGVQMSPAQLATLTLLPPDPHILLPLLIRVAEAEHKTMKKVSRMGQKMPSNPTIPLDEQWRTEFRAYLFRIPPYYQLALKRCLRHVLPSSAQSLLHVESIDAIAMQCFSNLCQQKIRNAEQISKENNDRIERQEIGPRQSHLGHDLANNDSNRASVKYGHFDHRGTVDSYLASLKNLPAPWLGKRENAIDQSVQQGHVSATPSSHNVLDIIGDLPASCTLGFYESRRRWIFGGCGETIKGLNVGGVRHEGSNSQRLGASFSESEECALTIAGIGALSKSQTSIAKMGEYRERLLFSRSPVASFAGSNDYAGVSATTGVDGSPVWSVDDDAMPCAFFDEATGLFVDSMQARVRAMLMVNFGNPYKERRGDSLVPEKFQSQTPTRLGDPQKSPYSSPPQDSFDSVEEGEAMFVQEARKSPSRTSPSRTSPKSSGQDTAEKSCITQTRPPPPPPRRKENSRDSLASGRLATGPMASESERASGTAPKTTLSKPPPPKPKIPPPSSSKPAKPAPPKLKKAPPPPKTKPKPPPIPNPPPPPPKPTASTKSTSTPVPIEASTPNPPVVPHPLNLERSKSNESSSSATSDGSNKTLTIQEMKKTSNAPDRPGQSDLENPGEKPRVDLPAGWMCVWSKSQKRWYFFDTKTNKSVWQWPP